MVSSTSLVLALVCAHAVSAVGWNFGLRKRTDVPTPFVPQRLNIPLSFDSSGRIVTSVTMAPTSGQQQFNFTLTTGTGLTYVASTQCATCSDVPLYNRSDSSTAQTFTNDNSIPLFGQNTGASIIKEFCQLHQQNGSVWPYPNQTIMMMSQQQPSVLEQVSNAMLGSTLSGIIGLGSNRGLSASGQNSSGFVANFYDSIPGQFFIRNPTAENFTFGMMLNPPLSTARGSNASGAIQGAGDPAGILHWLQPDPAAYDTSRISWADTHNNAASIPTVASNSTGAGDWFVGLDGWVMNSGSNHVSNTNSVVATVDPMYTDMYLPADQARLIHDAIPGSALRADLSSLGPLSQAWSIPCDASFSFGLIVGSQTFTLDQNSLVLRQPDGTCISGIEGWTDTTVTTYLFGSRFLSTVYLIFNVPKDGPNQIGFAPRADSSHSSSHVGAIVGGVIGGVAFIVIVAFIVFFFVYRHRRQAHRVTAAQYDHVEIEKPEDSDVQPFTLTSPTNIVQLMPGPESTTGSSGFSPLTTTFSPAMSSAPAGGMMGFGAHEHDHSLDVAPPTYEEASEGRPSPSRSVFPNEKAMYRARQTSETSETSQPLSSLPSPMRPVDENTPSASGSETLRE